MSTFDGYTSPYGFGPVTDAVIDCIGERRNLGSNELEDHIAAIREKQETEHPDGSFDEAELDHLVHDTWWTNHMGPAIDALEDALFPPKDSAEAFREANTPRQVLHDEDCINNCPTPVGEKCRIGHGCNHPDHTIGPNEDPAQ